MEREFAQIEWDQALEDDLRELVRLAIREDLGAAGDRTTAALVAEHVSGRAAVVARQPGVVAGTAAVPGILHQIDRELVWTAAVADAQTVAAGQPVGEIRGPVRGLLAAERIVLNFLGRLSGIATWTRRYVDAVRGTGARIYDTRKTTPGWRRLEKYAVRCGGGRNHRTGLFDALLIKDNHIAAVAATGADSAAAEAVRRVRQARGDDPSGRHLIIEVEVDTLEQLDGVLAAGPDIVLLDNMTVDQLREAVRRRNARAPQVQLEASGGVDLNTVRQIAETGVERISVGALTHSAPALDLGLDWLEL